MSTLAQFRSSVAGELGLTNTVAGDQTQIDLWVNQGVTDVMLRTNCQMEPATLALTAGTSDYELDTSILKIYDAYVTVGGNPYWMEFTSVDQVLAMRRSSTESVSPAQYYAVGGANLFMIYPAPATADTVTMYYLPRPAVLSVSSSSPTEIPAEFHPCVEYYAFYRGASFTDDTSSQGGQSYLQRYELLLRQMKRSVGLKGNHRLPPATVRRARSTVPFHDRSRYPV